MLSDRSYMRDDYDKRRTSVLVWVICALIAGFFLQVIFEKVFPQAYGAFIGLLQMSTTWLSGSRFWTVLTYTLLHENVWHVACNCLSIYFLGRELLPLLGERRFLGIVLSSALLGSLAWYGVNFNHYGSLIGASAVSVSLLVLFACFNPDRDITFLFFFIPVTIKPKYLAWITIGIDVLGLISSELGNGNGVLGTHVAHSAHLGGALAAAGYYWLIHKREWRNPDGGSEIELPKWMKRKKETPEAEAPKFKVNVTPSTNLKAEVDRILDKINSQGFASLTADEKKILDAAKDSLSRR